MEYNGDLFIKKFPKLTNTQMVDYFKKYESGDMSARDAIIYHNIIVVISRVVKVFYSFPFDKKDLVSIGIQGLIKAVDTFDSSKNTKFTTYAITCIDNEIGMFIRKEQKRITDVGMDEIAYKDEKNGDDIEFDKMLVDDSAIDLQADYLKKEEYKIIRALISGLPERERKIIMLRYGFINNRCYGQAEIASMLNMSQSYVSRLIVKIVKQFKEKIDYYEVMSIKDEEITNRFREYKKII